MVHDPYEIILDHLRIIRSDLGVLKKLRGEMREGFASVRAHQVAAHGDQALLERRVVSLESGLDRVKRRLDLADKPAKWLDPILAQSSSSDKDSAALRPRRTGVLSIAPRKEFLDQSIRVAPRTVAGSEIRLRRLCGVRQPLIIEFRYCNIHNVRPKQSSREGHSHQ